MNRSNLGIDGCELLLHTVPIFRDFLHNLHTAYQTGEGFVHLMELLIQILSITRNSQLIRQGPGIGLMHLLFQIRQPCLHGFHQMHHQ